MKHSFEFWKIITKHLLPTKRFEIAATSIFWGAIFLIFTHFGETKSNFFDDLNPQHEAPLVSRQGLLYDTTS